MTNHVFNRCRIEGPPEAVDAFERIALTEPAAKPGALARLFGASVRHTQAPRTLDAERVLPTPAGLYGEAAAAWRTEHWGIRDAPEPHGYERQGSGRAELTFYTPWSAPTALFGHLAGRLPDTLAITAEYVEAGNEYAGRIRISAGRCTEEELPFTRDLYERVTGETLDEDR